MKKVFMMGMLLALSFMCFVPAAFSTEDIVGTVIDVFGKGNVTIQIEGSHDLKSGNKIDLTYMAGVLPMMVGVYEITTVQKNIVLCKPVSTIIPVDKGMNVQIDVLRDRQ